MNGMIGLGQRLKPAKISFTVIPSQSLSAGRDAGIRILRPRAPSRGVLLHFHGGAWVLGNARLDDGWSSAIAMHCNMTVASADFHQALDDDVERAIRNACSVMEWTLDHLPELGADKLVIEGESSGAHLAACALLRLRGRRSIKEVAGFVAFCGAFDMSGSRSLKMADDSLIIDPRSAQENLRRLTSANQDNPIRRADLSPIQAELSGMPPALFIAGALDPIIDDSVRMHDRWRSHGSDATLLIVPEAPHGFERLPTRVARKTRTFMYEWVQSLL